MAPPQTHLSMSEMDASEGALPVILRRHGRSAESLKALTRLAGHRSSAAIWPPGRPLRYGRRRGGQIVWASLCRCALTCASVPRFSLGRHFSVVLSRFPLHLCTRADREKSLFIVAAGTLAASATLVVWRWDAADFSRPRPCWCWCQHRSPRVARLHGVAGTGVCTTQIRSAAPQP